jgi:rod shape-determining protein MreD
MQIRPNNRSKTVRHDYLGQEFPLPAKITLVYLSLVAAIVLNLLPFENIALILRPDFVALTLLYWGIHQPQQTGMSIAFITGLVMDVIDASIMGQHALAYCLITYFTLMLHRRLRMFSIFRQIPAVLWMLLLAQIAVFLTGTLAGSYISEWYLFFLSSVIGALAWPIISIALGSLRKQRSDPDEI